VPQKQIGYRLHPAIPQTYLQNLWRIAQQDTPLKEVAVPVSITKSSAAAYSQIAISEACSMPN
jgi:hypothetical protein